MLPLTESKQTHRQFIANNFTRSSFSYEPYSALLSATQLGQQQTVVRNKKRKVAVNIYIPSQIVILGSLQTLSHLTDKDKQTPLLCSSEQQIPPGMKYWPTLENSP